MNRNKLCRIRTIHHIFPVVLVLLLTFAGRSYAVTNAELLAQLFAQLQYAPVVDATTALPPDVTFDHQFAQEMRTAAKYGVISSKTPFSPNANANKHGAVRLALNSIGWGFEAKLAESMATLPELGGSGDPIFFLAAEMKPAAPEQLLLDGDSELSGEDLSALLSWIAACKTGVSWNRVFSYGGTDLVIYRQGIARPGNSYKGGSANIVGTQEPLYITAVAVDPGVTTQKIGFAEPLGMARMGISELASRYGAIAAVNGGFFSAGRPIGTMVLDGVPVGKPFPGRSAIGWSANGNVQFGRGNARIGVVTPNGPVEFNRYNAPPDESGAALYATSVTPSAVGTAPDALEIVVENKTVSQKREAAMSDHRVPPGGMLIVARGRSREALSSLQEGDVVEWISNWESPELATCANVIQSGPMLLSNGVFVSGTESFQQDVIVKRHPRTIVGSDGKRMLWVVVDGRSNMHSVGATMDETRWIAQSLGLTTALNLDGGGSSQLWWRGILMNKPSDGKERPLPYAVLMMPGAQEGQLAGSIPASTEQTQN